MALTFKMTKHLIRVHNQGSTDQTRSVPNWAVRSWSSYRTGPPKNWNLGPDQNPQKFKTSNRIGPGPRKISKSGTGPDQDQQNFENLRLIRTGRSPDLAVRGSLFTKELILFDGNTDRYFLSNRSPGYLEFDFAVMRKYFYRIQSQLSS